MDFNLECLQNKYNTFYKIDINKIQPYNLPLIKLFRDIQIVTWNSYLQLEKLLKDYMNKCNIDRISINEINIFAK